MNGMLLAWLQRVAPENAASRGMSGGYRWWYVGSQRAVLRVCTAVVLDLPNAPGCEQVPHNCFPSVSQHSVSQHHSHLPLPPLLPNKLQHLGNVHSLAHHRHFTLGDVHCLLRDGLALAVVFDTVLHRSPQLPQLDGHKVHKGCE